MGASNPTSMQYSYTDRIKKEPNFTVTASEWGVALGAFRPTYKSVHRALPNCVEPFEA